MLIGLFFGLSLEAMPCANMHEAKTHLSRLVQAAAQGEPFIIARGGTPMVKVVPIAPAERSQDRVRISSPADFDRMGSSEIEGLFEGDA